MHVVKKKKKKKNIFKGSKNKTKRADGPNLAKLHF